MSVQVESVHARCRETAGFLFSHPCRSPVAGNCQRCGKPVCVQHLRTLEDQQVCVGCERKAVQAGSRQDMLAARREVPYFYAWSYYDDYDDWGSFSESDREAFAAGPAGDADAGWETDWDAS